MADVLKPRDEKDAEDAVVWALSAGKALEVAGQGTKRAIGRPVQSDLTLDMSGLSGVTLYEPEELVLSARAGTPMREINDLVAASGQELAFEPADYGPLFGHAADAGTIGGAIATNLSGPRRIKAGAARDHFLGFTAVSGRGETFKSGGRVVKNVTGYDLCKLMAGAYGTLGAMTAVTVKTLPRAETEATLLLHALDDRRAVRVMADALGSACDISAAAHVPAGPAARLDGLRAPAAVTLLRLEGVAPSVAHRMEMLTALTGTVGVSDVLPADLSRPLWRAIRDVIPFADRGERPLWRISTAPMQGPDLVEAVAQIAGGEYFYDWGGGLVWLLLPPLDDAGAERVHAATLRFGGHATLIRAPLAIRASVAVFPPQDAGLAAITRRVKESFDPKGVFNPGRMWAGV